MSRLVLLLAATALGSSPALGQHAGHHMPGMTMPMPAPKKPVAKKSTAKKPAATKKAATKKPASKKAPIKKTKAVAKSPPKSAPAADPHAGHDMGGMDMGPTPADDPHAGHDRSGMGMSPATSDPHAGHDMSGMDMAPAPADPHAGHDMGAAAPSEIPVGPPPPGALGGPAHAADTIWGGDMMAGSRHHLGPHHGGMGHHKITIDRAEARIGKGRGGWLVDGEAWFGGDIDKAVFKYEGEGEFGHRLEHGEAQLLWSHAIGPFFDVQAGVRGDVEPTTRGRLVLGIEGLAPYWIHVDAAAFLSTKGDVTARFEAEHDIRLTQKWVLQPRIETDWALQNIQEEGVGRGLSTASAGLRLGYKIEPNFIPYVGVDAERAFGRTAHYRRAEGVHAGEIRAVVGLRAFF